MNCVLVPQRSRADPWPNAVWSVEEASLTLRDL